MLLSATAGTSRAQQHEPTLNEVSALVRQLRRGDAAQRLRAARQLCDMTVFLEHHSGAPPLSAGSAALLVC